MRTYSRLGFGLCVVVTLAVAVSAIADSLDFIKVTLQGRLADVNGQPVADGTYNISIQVLGQDGINNWGTNTTVTTKDGLYSVAIDNVPISAFTCDDGSIACEQEFSISLLGQGITLPSFAVGQTGRAGVAARVNGDIETSPGRIDFPARDQFAPQTARITDDGMEFIGTNGLPTLKFDNFLGPGHNLPTLDIADPTITTFGGPTSIKNSFEVNLFNDATPDFSVDNISGVLVRNQIFSVLPTATSFFGMDFTGRFSLNANATPLSDFEVTPGGITHIRSAEVRFDNNDDNLPNCYIESDGNWKFNTDNTGGYDVAFESNWIQFTKPVRVDGNGDGSNDVLLSDGGVTSFNPNGDANTELKVEPFLVTMQSGLIVKAIPAASFDNMIAGNNIFLADPNADGKREISSSGGVVDITGAVNWDINQDGTDEATFTAPGGNFTAELGGDVNVTGNITAIGTFTSGAGADITGACQWDVNGDATDDVTLTAPGGIATFAIDGNLDCSGIKNFVQQHPSDPDKEVVYTALEAGEVGTYTRGSGELTNGVAVIELPEHFALVTNANGLTAQITPRGPVQSMLYVESVTPTRIVVKASNPADATVPFDFMVNGVRAGFEDHPVIRTKSAMASSR